MWGWFGGTQVRVMPETRHEDNQDAINKPLQARFSVQVGAAVVVRA